MDFPVIPNLHALAVLLLTVLALILFTREKIALESSSLFVLVVLVVGFELFPFKTPGLNERKLEASDVLLVQGNAGDIARLKTGGELLVLAVLFGANLSFITPMSYKTNLLVMNAGGYKFSDFVKVGTPLTILMWAALSVILSVAYDL